MEWEKKERKRWERGRNSSMASSSIISLKGQDFVGGIGKSSELQMHRTAGYFPLPWPAKESSFKTHLPVNILAWLWVISPVWTRPNRAWRCTCTNPKTDLVTSDLPFSPAASLLIVMMIHPVAHAYFLPSEGFLTSSALNFKFPSIFFVFLTSTKTLHYFNPIIPRQLCSDIQTEAGLKSERNITATWVLIYKTQCIWNRDLINDKKMWHHNRANE